MSEQVISLAVFVLCRDQQESEKWQKRTLPIQLHHANISFHLPTGYSSFYRFINDAIAQENVPYLLFLHDDVTTGLGFYNRVIALIKELNDSHPNWGVVGNAGITPDGKSIYRYIKDPHGGPQKSSFPKPVFAIDGNTMLLNRKNFIEAGCNYPDMHGFHGYDLLLAVSCLLKGLIPLVDHRLMVFHDSGGNQQGFDQFTQNPDFGKYLSRNFINHLIPTLNGPIDLGEITDYTYFFKTGQTRMDLFSLFDQALKKSRVRIPTLTIVCRTQLNRPHLLKRAIDSFSVAATEAPELIDVRVLLITDTDQELLQTQTAKLQQSATGMKLDSMYVPRQDVGYSRTRVMHHAFEQIHTDFIWFVDDDDFIFPHAIRLIARLLSPYGNNLVIGDCLRYQEQWITNGDEVRFNEASILGQTKAHEVAKCFLGDNFTPLCGIIFPVKIMQNQIKNVMALGDYYEDYFFLMLAMTADQVELSLLDAVISGISIRGQENTVNQTDRSHWNESYAEFMGEFLNLPQTGSPLTWNLLGRPHQDKTIYLAPVPIKYAGLSRILVISGHFWHGLTRLINRREFSGKALWKIFRSYGFRQVIREIVTLGHRS